MHLRVLYGCQMKQGLFRCRILAGRFFPTESEGVFCSERAESLNIIHIILGFWMLISDVFQ